MSNVGMLSIVDRAGVSGVLCAVLSSCVLVGSCSDSK